jgi:hypothetical protein
MRDTVTEFLPHGKDAPTALLPEKETPREHGGTGGGLDVLDRRKLLPLTAM